MLVGDLFEALLRKSGKHSHLHNDEVVDFRAARMPEPAAPPEKSPEPTKFGQVRVGVYELRERGDTWVLRKDVRNPHSSVEFELLINTLQ